MPPVKVLYVAPGTGGFFGFGTDLGIISYSKLILLYYKSFRLSRTEIIRRGLNGRIKNTEVRSQMSEFQGIACGENFKKVNHGGKKNLLY